MNVDEVVAILKVAVPLILNKYFTRLKDSAIREFVRKVDTAPEVYTWDNGDEEKITWSHFFFGDDIVIGIGKRSDRIKLAKNTRKKAGAG